VNALLDAKTPQSEWDDSLRMRIDQILDLMLAEHGLAWYVEDGILQVTTKEFAEEHLINRSYDLEPFRKAGFDSGTILQIIKDVSDGLWEQIDGSGGKVVIVGDVMTIRQEFRVQRALSAMLQAMLDPGQPTYGVYHAEHMVCLHTLQNQTSVNFAELPLVDALQFLSVATGSRIYLDNSDLEDIGLQVDEPITLVMKDRSVATILHLLLRDLQLTTSIRSGELFITSREAASENLHTVVYDVRKLQNRDQLTIALESLTSGWWEEIDGSGGSLSSTENGLLVVRQTDQIHLEIAEFLKLYAGKPKSTVQTPQNSRSPLETRFYRVPAETAEDLLTALPSLVAPETWQVITPPGIAPDNNPLAIGTIRKVAAGQKVVELPGPKQSPQIANTKPSTGNQKTSEEKPKPTLPTEVMLVSESVLIINQTVAVHKEIDRFMRSLNLGNTDIGRKAAPQGGGLSGGGHF
jgi:hypothetical protein